MDQDLIDLLTGCRGGELDPARCEELLARLRNDARFRAEAAAEVRMLGMLKAVQSTEPRWLLLREELGCGAPRKKTEGELEADFLERVRGVRPRRARRPLGLAVVALAAALVAVATVRLWPRAGSPAKDATAAGTATAKDAADDGFAVVIQRVGAEWEPADGPTPAEGDVVGARRLRLRTGSATLAFLSGVTLTLEGPADVDVVSIGRVFCRRGRLRAMVPKGAEGFVIASPTSAVVDLGTEFGLNVEGDGKSRVMVFEGKAEAAVLNAEGSPLRSHLIGESRAIEIDPESGRIEEAAARSEDFVRPPALAAPPLVLDPSYRDAVLEAGPWGYWRFEAMDGGAVASEVAGRPPLRATGPVRLADAAGDNRCVEFGPGTVEQRLELDGLWEPPREPDYAVELWVLSERIGHAALASLIEPGPPGADYHHLFLVELTASDRQSLFPPASVRFLHRWPPGDAGGDNVFSSKYYIPYRWHHVVAQSDGGRMELYVDGTLTRSVSHRAERETRPCRLLVGRLKPLPRLEGRLHSRPFVGRIDELAVYNRPLAAEEVRRHFTLGTAAGHNPDR